MTETSLGIIIYSDGSQAEIIRQACHPMHGAVEIIVPLDKPRKLTMAPFGLPLNISKSGRK